MHNTFLAVLLTVFCALLLTACHQDEPAPVPPSEESSAASEAVTQPGTEPVPAADAPDFEVDYNGISGITFLLEEGNVIERINPYTKERKCAYRLDSVHAELEFYSTDGQDSRIKLTLRCKKIFDILGDDAKRRLVLPVRIIAEDKTVVAAKSFQFSGIYTVGDTIGDQEDDVISLIIPDMQPGCYTIELFNQPTDYFIPATREYPEVDPDTWYVIDAYSNRKDDSVDPPFMEGQNFAPWLKALLAGEYYIDDDLMLHGLGDTPFDLNGVSQETIQNALDDTILFEDQYGDGVIYTITDPAGLLPDVPPEDMPDRIRITDSPTGNIAYGEYPVLYISLIYFDAPDDEYPSSSIGLVSTAGAYCSVNSWERHLKIVQ